MFTKKMITLMVLATMLVAGAALAGEDYTVYGKLHTSLDMMNDSEDSQIMMSNNTSRFGIKGSKELNDKCSLIWQFESSLNLAQKGADTLAKRNSFLGLTGDWGTFLYGIHDTPFKTVGRKATFFYDEIGDFRQMTSTSWFNGDNRLQDVVVYASPDFSGFGFVLGYQVDQGDIAAEEGKTAMSMSAAYKQDGLYAGVAYEALSTGYAPMYMDGDNAVYGDGASAIRASVKYDFGTFAVAGLFQTLSGQMNSFTDVGEPAFADRGASTLGLEGKFKVNDTYSVKGAFYMTDPDTETDDNPDTADIDEEADGYSLFALGVDRKLSKSTYMYVQFAMIMNDDNAMKGIGGPGHGARTTYPMVEDPENPGSMIYVPGESPSTISWGLVTKF